MNFVTLDETVATAASTIADANSQFRLIARQWICRLALPQLGISEDDVKTVTLYPTSLAVPKPSDMRALLDISLFDANDRPLDHKFRYGAKRIYRDTRTAIGAVVDGGDSVSTTGAIPIDLGMDNYSFHLGTNGADVAAMIVRYYAYPTDDNGLPLIREDEMLALAFFCRFMWSVRNNAPLNVREMDRMQWATQCDMIRARKKMASLSPEHMKQITNLWVRGLPNFSFSKQF